MTQPLYNSLPKTAAIAVITVALGLQSCGKSSPDPVIINTTSVTKGDVNVPLYTGNTNGSKGSGSSAGNGGTSNGGGAGTGGSTGSGNTGGSTGGGSTGGGSTGGSGTGTGGSTGNTGGSTGSGNGGTTTGTISSNGDTGIAIGEMGSVTLKVGNKTYDLSIMKTDLAFASYNEAAAPLNLPSTSVNIMSNSTSGLAITFLAAETRTGVFDIAETFLSTPEGETYINTNPAQAKINFKTYTRKGDFVATQGTFDCILVEKDKGTTVRVSGSFNVLSL